jgi:hypothetical protein
MKGFIEVSIDGRKRMINLYQIACFESDTLDGTKVKGSIYVNGDGTFCIYCDESYDEIKWKIEEAQASTEINEKQDIMPWDEEAWKK